MNSCQPSSLIPNKRITFHLPLPLSMYRSSEEKAWLYLMPFTSLIVTLCVWWPNMLGLTLSTLACLSSHCDVYLVHISPIQSNPTVMCTWYLFPLSSLIPQWCLPGTYFPYPVWSHSDVYLVHISPIQSNPKVMCTWYIFPLSSLIPQKCVPGSYFPYPV